MTVNDGTLEKAEPVLFLNPESKNYDRDYQFALLLHQGAVVPTAAAKTGMTRNNARVVLYRLRQKAARHAGQAIGDPLVFALMFDRERAEAALEKIVVTGVTKNGENDGHTQK